MCGISLNEISSVNALKGIYQAISGRLSDFHMLYIRYRR